MEIKMRTGQKRRKTLVTIKNGSGNRFQTTLDYILVIGDKEPHIPLTEAG
jgi:ribosomal protein S4E